MKAKGYLREYWAIHNYLEALQERHAWRALRSLAKMILENADQRAPLHASGERGAYAPLSTHERGQVTLTNFLKAGGASHA
jgi:hypothetical protein